MPQAMPPVIGLCAIPELRHVLADLAMLLKERACAAVHLYCRSDQEIAYYRSAYGDGRFASVNFSDFLMRLSPDGDLDAATVISAARGHEAAIGTTINRLSLGNRQLARGYMIGGYYHPRSPITEGHGYLSVMNAYATQLSFWEREIREKKIGLMIGGLPDVVRTCRRMGVPYRVLRHARYKNQHYWSDDEFGFFPGLERAFENTVADDEAIRLTEPYLTEIALRTKFDSDDGVMPVLKNMAMMYVQHAYWRLRRYEKAKTTSATERALYFWRRWRDTRRVTEPRVARLSALDGKPFVFFPLQTEPEMTLLQNSPEYFFQLEAIVALSRALPPGVTLAVKEALFAVGRRPAGFYDQIAQLPNVAMIDMREQGVDVVARSRVVATISSTAGMEALIMGKPVVLMGRHNFFGFVPHARLMKAPGELASLLRWALDPAFDRGAARRDGARYVKALAGSSFSLGKYDYLDLRSYEAADVERAHDALVASMAAPAERRAA